MAALTDRPVLILVLTFLILWCATLLGGTVLRRRIMRQRAVRDDFNIILTTTLTLSGLIIGFTFSMAIGRYEQRKNYEEAEANAIGTEYLRADLLGEPAAAKVRFLLRTYLDERLSFYTARNESQVRQIDTRTTEMQTELWSAVTATVQPTAPSALALAGMNDVLNSEGYTQAAWWNRIPLAAWILMAAIATIAHVLVGYGTESPNSKSILSMVLPLVVSICFFLIADIDSPRTGIVRVKAQNLTSLAESLRAH
jgi:hypothetical protein